MFNKIKLEKMSLASLGIDLETDSLGIGQLAGSFGVEGCGNRPLFPGKSRREYEACVARQQGLIQQQLDLAGRSGPGAKTMEAAPPKPTNWFLWIGIAVAILIIFMMIRKKSD